MEWLKMLDWSDHASKQAIATVIYCTDHLSIGTNINQSQSHSSYHIGYLFIYLYLVFYQ